MNASEMPSKADILAMLYTWIHQRPGLEYGNYGNLSNYRSEVRRIGRQLADARTLLRQVELSGIGAPELMAAFRAYSGRLSIVPGKKPGTWALHYCTGQYWPTEYRAAACAVLSSALWAYKRDNAPVDAGRHEPHSNLQNLGDYLRASFRREYGRGFQMRHFD